MTKLSHEVFCDLTEPLNLNQAQVESSRCYYCYDAPCIQACPTEIDIPSFIRKISNGNVRGAAVDILSANIMGGTCARACPVETLCQSACVREKSEKKPVLIGQLQRFATDAFFKMPVAKQTFKRSASTGKKIAVVGAGPAGLSCAHRLSMLGNDVVIFEARPKSGGLNEYGLAPYKMTNDFAQREIEFLLSIGGISIEHGKRLGRDFTLADLKSKYAAVFLGVGLGGVNRLGIPGEELRGVQDAAPFIAEIRQTKDLSKIQIGQNVVVIGGGNTAVDIAIQARKIGAENVTLAYRRGTENMGATHHEQELAKLNGVLIKTWAKPLKISGDAGVVKSIDFEVTHPETKSSKTLTLKADQIFKAIGQTLLDDGLSAPLKLETKLGKIQVDADFQTSVPGIYSGGDCNGVGEDLTVTAVQHGKLAAIAIHKKISGAQNG